MFTDTTLERNALMENVYPKLKEFLRERYGLEFQVVMPFSIDNNMCHVCSQILKKKFSRSGGDGGGSSNDTALRSCLVKQFSLQQVLKYNQDCLDRRDYTWLNH